MTGASLHRMIRDLESADLLPDDREILDPIFERQGAEVMALPEMIISHIQRLHSQFCQ